MSTGWFYLAAMIGMYGVANLLQSVAAANTTAHETLDPKLLMRLVRHRTYIAGLLERFPKARYVDSSSALPDEAFKDAHHVNAFGEHLMCKHLSQSVVPDAFAALKADAASRGLARGPQRRETEPSSTR